MEEDQTGAFLLPISVCLSSRACPNPISPSKALTQTSAQDNNLWSHSRWLPQALPLPLMSGSGERYRQSLKAARSDSRRHRTITSVAFLSFPLHDAARVYLISLCLIGPTQPCLLTIFPKEGFVWTSVAVSLPQLEAHVPQMQSPGPTSDSSRRHPECL